MELVFDGTLFVHYGFVHVSTEDEPDIPADLDLFFAGQRNGICGAAVPHILSMMTGTHTGDIPLRIEWHADAPPADDAWEDVVAVSTEVRSTAGQLSTFDDYLDVTLPATGPHRVRYCAFGMDAAQEAEEDDAAPPDRYLVHLWPAPPSPDEIVRAGTERAQYWHDEMGGSPALTADEIAARRVAEDDIGEDDDGEDDDGEDDAFADVSDDDTDAVEILRALLALHPDAQRETARWLARQAVEAADLADDPGFAAALSALDAGQPLPAPFNHFASAAEAALHHRVDESPALSSATIHDDLEIVETVNDPEPDDHFGWYGEFTGAGDGRLLSRAVHAVTALDAAAGSDAARAVVVAYRSAAATDDTGDRLTRKLFERLSMTPDD